VVSYGRTEYARGLSLEQALAVPTAGLPDGAMIVDERGTVCARLERFRDEAAGDSYRAWFLVRRAA